MSKPRVLVLGGLGFVGRHLVKHMVDNGLASKIRVADKTMMAMARLGKGFTEAFETVECIQTNLSNPDGATKAFTDPEGSFDVVFNLASETKLSQQDAVYEQGITKLAQVCANEAAKHKIEKYILISTSEVYESNTKPSTESSPLKPWSGIGRAKLSAEEVTRAVASLNLIVVRPGTVYGPGDIRGLAPQICIGAVFKKTGEKLEYPTWFESSKISTVHVSDVARALWFLALNGKKGDIYNLADSNDTDQKKINMILEEIYGFKIETLGLLKSEAAKLLSTETLQEEINSEVIPTWVKMTKEAKLDYSPLSPYLDSELLANKSMCVDGSAIEKAGFKYEHPKVTAAEVKEQINHAVSEGWFPPGLVQ